MVTNLDLDESFDFGFSAVSEEELALKEKEAEARALAEAERVIQAQADEADQVINDITATAEEYKDRLILLYKMVLPLLNNLAADGDTKSYIYWPNRADKIEEFRAKINAVVNG